MHFLPITNKWKHLGKALSGGFSCVNTGLLFHSKTLMPNLTEKDFQKMNVNQSLRSISVTF